MAEGHKLPQYYKCRTHIIGKGIQFSVTFSLFSASFLSCFAGILGHVNNHMWPPAFRQFSGPVLPSARIIYSDQFYSQHPAFGLNSYTNKTLLSLWSLAMLHSGIDSGDFLQISGMFWEKSSSSRHVLRAGSPRCLWVTTLRRTFSISSMEESLRQAENMNVWWLLLQEELVECSLQAFSTTTSTTDLGKCFSILSLCLH